MDDKETLLCLYLLHLQRKKRKTKRRKCIHPLNINESFAGIFVSLFNELRRDEDKFYNYFRMSIVSFDEHLSKIQG